MQTASGSFATAVLSPDQRVAYQVIIGFPSGVQASYSDVTDCVLDINITRSVTTALPDGTTLVSGYPTASATVKLTGLLNQNVGVLPSPTATIYWLMNPYDPTSPMYRITRAGLPITIKAGLYDGTNVPELITIFSGTIDTCATSYGEVQLTCRDQRASITNQAVLPPVITQTPQNAMLTSEFAIDYLLRHSSPAQYLSWPALHSNCVLAISMRSSIWPEVGALEPGYAQGPVFTPAPYGTGLGAAAVPMAFTPVTAPLTTDKNCGHLLAGGNFVVVLTQPNQLYQLIVFWSGTTLFVFTQTPTGTSVAGLALAITTDIHEIEFSLSWAASSTSFTGTVWVDGTPHAVSGTALDARPVNYSFSRITVGGNTGGVAGVQITTEAAYASRYPFTPTLILDPGGSLNPLVALPDITGQDTWGVLQDIASAESAFIGLDELGLMYFINRNTIATTSSVRTVTATTSLLSLDTQEQMSMVATHLQLPVTPIAIQPFGVVWSIPTIVQVPAGQTFTTSAVLDNPIVALGTSITLIPSGGVIPVGFSAYRAARNQDGTGGAVTNLIMTVVQLAPTVVTITIKNPNGFPVWLVSPSGAGYPTGSNGVAAVVLAAQAVTSASTATDTATSVSGNAYADAQWPPLTDGGAITNTQFGEVLLQLTSNNWNQDLDAAQVLVDDLLSDYYQPRPLYRNVSIIADPRLQLLDRVTLVDPVISQLNSDALLLGITTQLGSGRWTQNIDALAVYAPGDWILDSTVYSILDSTTYI